jgi:hypothetical protein
MFQEFPKWLYPEGKPPVLVHDAAQEAALAGMSSLADDTPQPAPVAQAAELPAEVKRGPGRPRKVA